MLLQLLCESMYFRCECWTMKNTFMKIINVMISWKLLMSQMFNFRIAIFHKFPAKNNKFRTNAFKQSGIYNVDWNVNIKIN